MTVQRTPAQIQFDELTKFEALRKQKIERNQQILARNYPPYTVGELTGFFNELLVYQQRVADFQLAARALLDMGLPELSNRVNEELNIIKGEIPIAQQTIAQAGGQLARLISIQSGADNYCRQRQREAYEYRSATDAIVRLGWNILIQS